MKYCPCCKRMNLGRPVICYYCGRSWNVRLCPSGHANPPDAKVCGTCGKFELTSTAGPLPWWVKAMVTAFVALVVLEMIYVVPLLIVGVGGQVLVIVFVWMVAFWFLPASFKNTAAKFCMAALRLLGRVIRFLLFGREPKSRGR